MASLFKPTIISYTGPDGHKCTKAEATGEDGKLRSGFRRRKTKSSKWYARIRYPDGVVKRLPLFEDKVASQARLKDLLTDAERSEAGIRDKFQEHRRRRLVEHLEDFRRYLLAKGNTEVHAGHTYMRAKAVIEGCKFERIGDLSPSRVVEFLAELQKTKGLGIATSNYYLQAIKSFNRWLQRDNRTAENALQHLSRQNAKADVRLERRSLSEAEFEALIAAAAEGPEIKGLSGPDREMLYLTAAGTGFRAGELASLTRASFDLKADPPTVTVAAAYSKRRRRDEQPIRRDLAERLGEWMAGKEADKPLWPAYRWGWSKEAAEMVREDLAAARQAWLEQFRDPAEREAEAKSKYLLPVDGSGHVFDFHALRH